MKKESLREKFKPWLQSHKMSAAALQEYKYFMSVSTFKKPSWMNYWCTDELLKVCLCSLCCIGAYSCSILCTNTVWHSTWIICRVNSEKSIIQYSTVCKSTLYDCGFRTGDWTLSSPWHHHLCYFWRRNRKLCSMLQRRQSLQDQRHSAPGQSACVRPPDHSVSSRQPTTFTYNRWAIWCPESNSQDCVGLCGYTCIILIDLNWAMVLCEIRVLIC